jgi:hypothetical protein
MYENDGLDKAKGSSSESGKNFPIVVGKSTNTLALCTKYILKGENTRTTKVIGMNIK